MNGANRWLLYAPFIVAGVLLIGWRILWLSGAERMREELEKFAATQAAAGVIVAYEPLKTRGFPFFLRGVVDDLSISKGADRYECARVYLDALPYAGDRLIISPSGAQRIISNKSTWTIVADGARASIESDDARDWVFKAESGASSASSGMVQISVEKALINLAPGVDDPSSIEASMRVFGLKMAAPDRSTFVERADAAAGLSAAGAASERRLTLHGAELIVNEAVLKAEGSLLIQAGRPPQGRLDAEVEKPVGLARAFGEAQILTAEEARAAEAGFAMLSVASGGVIHAPIEIEAGKVSFAGRP